MMDTSPPSIDSHPRRRMAVLDTTINYVDVGTGDPIVFLHGNPTSSYLWRNIIPHLAGLGRCLAPDLVGMGGSGAPSGLAYRFADHARYLDAWFEALGLDRDVVLVGHDWGSVLGFDWAARHPERVRGIAYMEAIIQPWLWADMSPIRSALLRALRSDHGEALVFDQNFFVEAMPQSVLRPLNDAEMGAYRAPFRDRGARLPLLSWAREFPIEGEPADVTAIVRRYGDWLAASPVPKLLIIADPGALLTGRALDFCRRWPNQREVTVRGLHYIQEDSPDDIGRALRSFVEGLRH